MIKRDGAVSAVPSILTGRLMLATWLRPKRNRGRNESSIQQTYTWDITSSLSAYNPPHFAGTETASTGIGGSP